MGDKDTKSKEYMANNEHFADLCNYALYNGNSIIQPEELMEQDSTENLSILLSDGNEELVQRWRDLLKKAVIKSDGKAIYILIGVENQTEVHYAMPIRTMLYDALNYSSQVKDIALRHRKQKDEMSKAEFLSGFCQTDKLMPVITITVYWGSDAWDAPTNLHDMFDDIDVELKGFIPDYHINLVAPYHMQESDFKKFQTTLGKILKFLKYAKDKNKLGQVLAEDITYKTLDNDAVSMINLFADAKIKLEEQKEETDVCQAIEEMKEECKAAECIKTVENAMKNFSVSLEEACKALGYTIEAYQEAKLIVAK